MPIRPSGGNWLDSKPSEYLVAAPRRWVVAVSPPRVTVSVYCSPETVEPSPYASENVLPASLAVLLEAVLYLVWPEHVEPHLELGRKRSLEPVSKSTVKSRYEHHFDIR